MPYGVPINIIDIIFAILYSLQSFFSALQELNIFITKNLIIFFF